MTSKDAGRGARAGRARTRCETSEGGPQASDFVTADDGPRAVSKGVWLIFPFRKSENYILRQERGQSSAPIPVTFSAMSLDPERNWGEGFIHTPCVAHVASGGRLPAAASPC